MTIEITPERLNRPLLVTIEAVLDKSGKPAAVVCTARDLSELRKVEAVAREHQSLLTNILESARESIYAVDTQGRFKWCNSATLRGLGYKREDFIGRHLLEMIYEGDRELVSQKLADALKGEPQTCEFRYFARDGKLRYTRVDQSPLVVDGRTTGVLGIARDITEQKEERERAARADKLRALGQLASGVAHDFNNSLAAILGRAQLLHRQTKIRPCCATWKLSRRPPRMQPRPCAAFRPLRANHRLRNLSWLMFAACSTMQSRSRAHAGTTKRACAGSTTR